MPTIFTCPVHQQILNPRPDGTCSCGRICDTHEMEWECGECGWRGMPDDERAEYDAQNCEYIYFATCPNGHEMMWREDG